MESKAVKTKSNKALAIFVLVSFALIIGLVALTLSLVGKSGNEEAVSAQTQGDSQIIEILAKGGFTPNLMTAKAGVPTKLNVSTQNTIDCSSTLSIPSLNIHKNLPITGNVSVDIPAQKAGTALNITCSMGMYNATINFN